MIAPPFWTISAAGWRMSPRRPTCRASRRTGFCPPRNWRGSRAAHLPTSRCAQSGRRYGASGHTARLNHQKPILHGLAAANRVVEGHDAASWAEVLNARVFFWPERHLRGPFLASVQRDLETAVIWLDTEALLDRASDRLDLSPINSGNFTQGGAHARRGNWLFVPARAGLEAFRRNRQARGLVRAPDAVKEISLRGALAANDLAASRVDSETDGQGAQ
ncbi:DUF7002 family protein [Roseivivax marinus]|uniref:DUF7002 family protein n=1 Tax=Roseivivax marinus TaxID=1379903 RepID=UPI00273F0DD6|nr:hypothetical protein [Roseivivax marinus]